MTIRKAVKLFGEALPLIVEKSYNNKKILVSDLIETFIKVSIKNDEIIMDDNGMSIKELIKKYSNLKNKEVKLNIS